jgi:hypothetical protein
VTPLPPGVEESAVVFAGSFPIEFRDSIRADARTIGECDLVDDGIRE